MGAVTRDLLPFSVGRNVSESITLIYTGKVLKKDGSFDVTPTTETKLARVVPLTRSEINRLLVAGITINNGYSISFPGEVIKVPDLITLANGLQVRIKDHTVEEGTSVFVASQPSFGDAEVTP